MRGRLQRECETYIAAQRLYRIEFEIVNIELAQRLAFIAGWSAAGGFTKRKWWQWWRQ